jgi:multiple sugar transport system substrate-binding protein
MMKKFSSKQFSVVAGWVGLLLMTAVFAANADTVRVTIPFYSKETEPYFQKMASEFKQKNPDIDIQIEIVNWDTLLQKLTTDIAANANADISIIGTRWLADFQKQDLVEPLDGYMDPSFKDRFIKSVFDYATIGGKTNGLPIAASARALYYNKQLFTKAGFPDGPKTWTDVEQAAKKIKDAGKAVFDSDAGVKALEEYKKLIDQGLTQPGVTSYSREDVQNLFKQGRVGTVITAPFLINQLKSDAANLEYGITAIPSDKGNLSMAVTDTIVIFKNSKAKKSAWKFLDFLFTKEPRIAFTKGEGFLPTTKAEAEDPYFTQNERLQVFVKLLENGKFTPLVSGYDAMSDAVVRGLQSVYLGKAKPADALKQAAQEASAAICK